MVERIKTAKTSLCFTAIGHLIKLTDIFLIGDLLLNFDLKLISKSLATSVKKVLSNLFDARQTGYVNERFIGESDRLTDDVIKACL